MSEILKRLASCERVTEWVSQYDERLSIATGEAIPNDGAQLQTLWTPSSEKETNAIVHEVQRIIVPNHDNLRDLAKASFGAIKIGRHKGGGTVILDFASEQDWGECFPISPEHVVEPGGRLEGTRAWAAVGLCHRAIGLAVFASVPPSGDGVRARILQVPDEHFKTIINS